MVSESFGGWGFMGALEAEISPPVKEHDQLEPVWETDALFLTPESVLYDPHKDLLYVSSFDIRFVAEAKQESEYTGYISKLDLNGDVLDQMWIPHLHTPCGLALKENRLYTVERRYLTEIDTDITPDGDIYITDTSPTSHIDSQRDFG